MKGQNVRITFSFELLNWGHEPALGQVSSALDATEGKAVEARKISSALPVNQLFVSTILRQVVSFSVSKYITRRYFSLFLFFWIWIWNCVLFICCGITFTGRWMGIDRIGLFSTAIRIREGNNISMQKVNKIFSLLFVSLYSKKKRTTALHLWEYPSFTIYTFPIPLLCLVSREKFSIWRCLCSHIHRLAATFFMSARPPLLFFSFLFIYTQQQQQQNIAAHGSLSLPLSLKESRVFLCAL